MCGMAEHDETQAFENIGLVAGNDHSRHLKVAD
ncbi:MAG: hypothetical protein ACI9OJ_004324, partial [Myxococcota bacterium]